MTFGYPDHELRQKLIRACSTLGIKPTATKDEARKAFKRLSWICHPDRNQDDPQRNSERQGKLGEAILAIEENYEHLQRLCCQKNKADGGKAKGPQDATGQHAPGPGPGVGENLIEIMITRKRWRGVVSTLPQMYGSCPDMRQVLQSIVDRHLDDLALSGEPELLAFAWKNVSGANSRHRIMEALLLAGKTGEIRSLIFGMAEELQWNWIAHYGERGFHGNEELKQLALSLLEGQIESIIGFKLKRAVDFVLKNTENREIKKRIYEACPETRPRGPWNAVKGFFGNVKDKIADLG